MKKINFGTIGIVAILLSVSAIGCNGKSSSNENNEAKVESNEVEVKTEQEVQSDASPLIDGYMNIKDALVNDNPSEVQEEAKDLLEESEIKQYKQIESALTKLSNTSDLAEQRKYFAELSQQLYQALQGDLKADETLYLNHCPMAMGDNGANWLSTTEKISNPYMGQKMPGCGSVKETIKN